MIGFLLIVFGIPLLWIFICGVMALFSGWRKLAKKYKEDKTGENKFSAEQHEVIRLGEGYYFRGVSGCMGLPFLAATYGNCLHVIVGEFALGLRMTFLFKPFNPNLYVPWKDIRHVTYRSFFIFSITRIYVQGHWRRITLYGRAGQCVYETFNEAKQT